MPSKRAYARYVMIGKLNLFELVAVARKHGMAVICGHKPNMHVFNEIGIYGTAEQMRKVEHEWQAGGQRVERYKPSAAFGIKPADIPRERWADVMNPPNADVVNPP